MLIIGQFVIIRHVIQYLLFVGMRKQYRKKSIKPYCSEICQICWERKSGKYKQVSCSYRGLEFGPQRITQRIFYRDITGVPVDSRYCVIICSIYSCIWIEYGSSSVQVSGFARRPQCLLPWHFCSPSADARAILTQGHQTLLYVSSFLGRVSRDYFICLSVIINYDFDLSVFIFPKSGVKISNFSF